jgi:hypothetical protein
VSGLPHSDSSAAATVLERNYRTREGEINIVARRDHTLVFYEVKTIGVSVLLRQPQGFEGVRVVSAARFVSGQAGDGLENEYRTDPDDEPVPEAEALVYPFADGDSDDESKRADRPPATNARIRPSHARPSSVDQSNALYPPGGWGTTAVEGERTGSKAQAQESA